MLRMLSSPLFAVAVSAAVVAEALVQFWRLALQSRWSAACALQTSCTDVVKAMQQNMELVTDSYRAGKIDFLQLMVIRRQAVEARREYIDVLEELNAAQASLDRAVGQPW